jgi:hypothetical protein
VDLPSDHPKPSDDDPLFVPDEFEAEHLEQARRMVQAKSERRSIGQRFVRLATGRRGGTPKQRLTSLIVSLHGVAVLFAVVISAVTGTWLPGVAVSALIGLSLWTAFRLIHVIKQVHAHELAHRQQSTG